jgi:hypothetical protein
MNELCHFPGCKEERYGFTALCDTHRKWRNNKRGGNLHSNKTRGRKNPLTDDEMAEIRRRLSRFESPAKIAASFGVTKSAIHYALKRQEK